MFKLVCKKLLKPRSLIFCKDKTNHKERLIYNYLLFKLKEDKHIILKEKEGVEGLGYQYKGHNLQITFKELKEHLNLCKKSDIVKMFDNLRSVDIQQHILTDFNIGRKNKSTFTAKLIGDIKEYNNENEFFELTFSPLIVNLVLFENNDYTQLFLEDLIKFKSKYSLIIYEILKASFIPHFNNNQPLVMELNDFKSLLNIENYNISNLKQRVLNKAIEDIKNLTDYKIEYEFLTGNFGKNYRFVKLTFDTKQGIKRSEYIENKKVKNLTQKELIFLLKDKLPPDMLTQQLFQENIELEKALSFERRKSNMLLDDLDSLHQESELCF